MTPQRDPSTSPVPFGKYLLLAKIGKGGMADVFLARPRGQQRLVAIKCIRETLAKSREFVDMFVREGKLAMMLNHDAVVKTYEIGKVHGRHFICMEYIAGVDLAMVLRRAKSTRLPVPHAIFIAMRIFEGLHYAHELTDGAGEPLNLVNRDVSPSNVRVSFDGDVKLLDFGIAKTMAGARSEIGQLKGKVSHMSPEQVRALPLDRRSDVFSAGIVLYELLTLEQLFRAETDFHRMDMVRRAEVAPPSAVNPRVSRELDAVVLRALQKAPEDRFQRADEVAVALREMLVEYHFEKHELRDFVRDLCAPEYEKHQQLVTDSQSDDVGEVPMDSFSEVDYGELLEVSDVPTADPPLPPKKQPTWLYVLLGAAVVLLLLAVVLLLFL
jgi:eukaryotic-like serine/threonine-protein kinase